MKDSVLILKETRSSSFRADDNMISRTVSAWLTKELQKCGK